MSSKDAESPDQSEVDRWQTEEIEKGIGEADRGEFATEEEVEQVLRRWTGTSRVRRL
jgi:predicted transcriptional regulator